MWKEIAVIQPHGTIRRREFICIDDIEALAHLQKQANNTDLVISAATYTAPHRQAEFLSPLYFKIRGSLEQVRTKTLGACYYIADKFNIPEDCIEVVYYGDGDSKNTDNYDSANENNNTATATMLILIPPIVFGSQPTTLMPIINHCLANLLARDGIDIDIDIYQRNYFIKLPNSVNSDTGCFVIPLQKKELLYMDASRIVELSKQPRSDNSLSLPRTIQEAVRWFSKVHKEAEENNKRQCQLQNMMLEKGWQISPCIRQLLWVDFNKNVALEAYRVMAQFYSFIKAGEDEIMYQIYRLRKQNQIIDSEKVKPIVDFAVENVFFPGCNHPLLKQFCPSNKCFMAELINEYENPRLFTKV